MIFGVDVSAYQPNFDFAACRREGYDFAIIKATEGTGWRSAYFANQLARARAAGLLVAAYHYVRGEDVDGQLRNIRSMVPSDVPVVLDVEDGAGSIGSIRALNAAVNRAGYRTPLIYIPRWYWQGHMGSPDLSGLPPNWHSRYPDNVVRRKEGFQLGPEYWPTFGALRTEVAQFTSSLAVANYPSGRIDGNAYRGTREDFARLLGGSQEEDDMAGEGREILEIVQNLANWMLHGGPGPDALYRGEPVDGLSPTSAVAVLHDTNRAMRGVWELTGQTFGQVMKGLVQRPDVSIGEAEARLIADELASAGLPDAFVAALAAALTKNTDSA